MILEKLNKSSNLELLGNAKELVYFLEKHNKNYTKQQYYNILELQEIILHLLQREKQ